MTRNAEVIVLPPPQTTGGRPLMQLLSERRSGREFDASALSLQTLSDLLWAATGVNRPDVGKRTAPTARDRREIDVYVILTDGAYRFDIETHALRLVLAEDIRVLAGTQDFVQAVPVNLVYVADFARMAEVGAEQQLIYSSTDVGFIAQNVYLFSASAGLSTVVRGSIDRLALGNALKLSSEQRIVLAQSVGFPAK